MLSWMPCVPPACEAGAASRRTIMENNVSPEQRLVLDRLLTKIAGSLDGALDLWTLVCLGEFPIDCRRFMAEKTETLRAFIVVAQAFLAEAGLADNAAIHR